MILVIDDHLFIIVLNTILLLLTLYLLLLIRLLTLVTHDGCFNVRWNIFIAYIHRFYHFIE